VNRKEYAVNKRKQVLQAVREQPGANTPQLKRQCKDFGGSVTNALRYLLNHGYVTNIKQDVDNAKSGFNGRLYKQRVCSWYPTDKDGEP